MGLPGAELLSPIHPHEVVMHRSISANVAVEPRVRTDLIQPPASDNADCEGFRSPSERNPSQSGGDPPVGGT
jgi:hypothetical protein